MKTLRDFLLAEAKEDNKGKNNKGEASQKSYPEGFAIVSNQGGLTKEAQEAMGAANFTAAMDIAAVKNPQKIFDEFGSVSGKTPYDVLKGIVGNKNKFNEVFQAKVSKLPEYPDSVVLYFKDNSWTTLAKTESSSSRLVKFWIQSLLLAYGVKTPSKLTYLKNIDYDMFAVH